MHARCDSQHSSGSTSTIAFADATSSSTAEYSSPSPPEAAAGLAVVLAASATWRCWTGIDMSVSLLAAVSASRGTATGSANVIDAANGRSARVTLVVSASVQVRVGIIRIQAGRGWLHVSTLVEVKVSCLAMTAPMASDVQTRDRHTEWRRTQEPADSLPSDPPFWPFGNIPCKCAHGHHHTSARAHVPEVAPVVGCVATHGTHLLGETLQRRFVVPPARQAGEPQP